MVPRPSRLPVSRAARLLFGQGDEGVPARILDVSQRGARVFVPDSGCVPYVFDLLDVFSGTRRKSKVMWRTEQTMGVMFVDIAAWPSPERPAVPSTFGFRAQDRK